MRPRSLSMYIEKGSIPENNDNDTSISSDDDWLLEDKLKLIVKIKDLLPSKDNLPFDERIQNIKWKNIEIGSYSSTEIKQKFTSILKDIRKYRILTEIVKDAEKDLLAALHIKKPLTTFALFIKENKDKISTKNSEINGTYTQTASNIFKSLSDKERKQYEFKAQKAKKDYAEELSKFHLDKDSSTKNKTSSKTSIQTPFLYFWNELKRNENTANYNNARKEYSEMRTKEKMKWILKFLGATRGKLLSLEQFEKAVSHLNKEEMSLIDEYEKRPKKTNAFNMFMGRYLKSAEKMNVRTDVFKSGVESWKNLSETEKLKFKKQSAELKTQYDKDLEAFLESLPEDRKNYEKNKNKKPTAKKISAEKPPEEITEVKKPSEEIKKKKKRSRKLDTNEKEEDVITMEPIQKTRKLSDNSKSTKSNNLSSSEKSKTKSFDMKLVKPPGSLFKYFALQVFKGPKEKAKSEFKLLKKNQREKLQKQYEKTKTKYLKDFEKYLVALSAEEIALFAKEINEHTIDDSISDITDSD